MPNIKRITDLEDYKSVLPYASEIFGVYQPLIGWKSRRQLDRVKECLKSEMTALLARLGQNLENQATILVNSDCAVSAPNLKPAGYATARLVEQNSIVLQEVAGLLKNGMPQDEGAWKQIVDEKTLTTILRTKVMEHYNRLSLDNCRRINTLTIGGQNAEGLQRRKKLLKEANDREIQSLIAEESVFAGVVQLLVKHGRVNELNMIFFTNHNMDGKQGFAKAMKSAMDLKNPYHLFDSHNDAENVSLSPLGIVHLYRQYFFELDTFLGTPTGHVWISPGATVELVEISTRRVLTEKTVETVLETVSRSEKSTTDQDEISEAVKQDNRDDLKLGITSTVNQSWGTGNATATASLNMDKTQQVGRETSHKKMRQQSEKLSTEIRQSYKSTFKTITEVTDTSSKRYVLSNVTGKLINYELRRKMRQVAVQVQDIGSYLCWETFVDEPGDGLGLSNLVHLAQPADLLPVPDQTKIPYPSDQLVPFKANAVWNFGDTRRYAFVVLTPVDPPAAPEGFELVWEPGMKVDITQISGSGEDFTGTWDFGAEFATDGQLLIGVQAGLRGISWDKRVDFVLGGVMKYTATAAKKAEIDAANKTKEDAATTATTANQRNTKEAFIKTAKERIEFAGDVVKRRFEDLREEERITVYRRLIESLMTTYQYKLSEDATRHVLSELINSIFDIDKMLYFVAPEWWKPRKQAKESLRLPDLQSNLSDSVVSWSDDRNRPDNYLITEKSKPAPLGSSLGWLLQLDGDDLRNAFLNAPWVKAVIPIRPDKEQEAMNWLQNAMVEGVDGLGDEYKASTEELDKIRTELAIPAAEPITIKDALKVLCREVALKHAESNKTKKFPDSEINDDNKVTSTPIEKVYEHGFYPLKGGFRINPNGPNTDPNNQDKNFQIFDQWIEILPTDQVVPVEVSYDPKTGRQI